MGVLESGQESHPACEVHDQKDHQYHYQDTEKSHLILCKSIFFLRFWELVYPAVTASSSQSQ